MKRNFVDCFMLMNTALSLKGGQKLPEMSRPLIQDVFTTVVNVSLSVQNFKITDLHSMETETSALLNQRWTDPRLGANLIRTRKMAVAGQIWKPKITNLNGHVDGQKCCNNEDTVFWRGYGNEGNVLLSEKINIKVSCTQDFQDFPFDTQTCQLKFGSYRFPVDEVTLQWDDENGGADFNSKPLLNEFEVTNLTTFTETDRRASANFSVAIIELTLKRLSSHYIYCTIVPTFILVLITYVSIWFDLNNRSLRSNLNSFTFGGLLCLFYLSTCVTQPVAYLKALDVYVLIGGWFSLAVLIETFVIDIFCEVEEVQFHLKRKASGKEYPKWVYWMEMGMKIGYPVFYVFTTLLYCLIYV